MTAHLLSWTTAILVGPRFKDLPIIIFTSHIFSFPCSLSFQDNRHIGRTLVRKSYFHFFHLQTLQKVSTSLHLKTSSYDGPSSFLDNRHIGRTQVRRSSYHYFYFTYLFFSLFTFFPWHLPLDSASRRTSLSILFLLMSSFYLFLLGPPAAWIQSDPDPTGSSLSLFSLFRRCHGWSKEIIARSWMIQSDLLLLFWRVHGYLHLRTPLSLLWRAIGFLFCRSPFTLLAAVFPPCAAHPPKAFSGGFCQHRSFIHDGVTGCATVSSKSTFTWSDSFAKTPDISASFWSLLILLSSVLPFLLSDATGISNPMTALRRSSSFSSAPSMTWLRNGFLVSTHSTAEVNVFLNLFH